MGLIARPSGGLAEPTCPQNAGSSSASLSPVAWQPGQGITFDHWVRHGRRLGTIGRGTGWWIGDWLNYGNMAYGQRYARAARITGYDSQTLMNMTYVASRFEASRRREGLSWSHHAEVAALAPEEQDEWLARAEKDRLSVRDLRAEVRRQRALDGKEPRQASRADALPAAGRDDIVCPECGCAFSTNTDGRRATEREDRVLVHQ